MRLRARAVLCLLAVLLVPAAAWAQVPPDEHWMTLTSPHFRVHYPRGLDDLGRRAADRAERAWSGLAADVVDPPKGRIDLVVSDNVDYSNGYATPLPTNRVVVYAHPPVDEPALSFYDDWLQLVISHELTHVFHLDYGRGAYRALRMVLGRNPAAFPNLFTPGWTKEGLAVYEESRLTRAGRLRGTLHETELRTAVLEDRFFSIDRASGDPVSWPGGYTSYTYGSEFMRYLGARFGEEPVRRFVRIMGRRLIPYRMDAAAKAAFGVTLTRAWSDWHAQLGAQYGALADSLRREGVTEPELLTTAGQYAQFPRWLPDGSLVYAASTGRSEPVTRILMPGARDRALAPRTSLAPTAVVGDGSFVTSQIDARDPYRDLSDLYRVGRRGDVDRITRGARLEEPDVSRTGRIVALRSGGGTTVPVLVDGATGAVKPLAEPSLDVQWGLPRWSPDGSRIALSRWRRGGFFDVVVMDTAGAVVRELTHDRAVDDVPAWSPDGRYVVFSSDRDGIANLYAYDLQDGRLMRITRVLTGAYQPDVSPDGRWIAFQWYHADGYHIARVPFDPAAWTPAPPVRAEVRDSAPVPAGVTADVGPPKPYSPARSLVPVYWMPVVYQQSTLGLALGGSTGMEDLVGRHAYGVSAAVRPRDGRTDWGAGYSFAGLVNPVIGASVFQDWSVLYDAKTFPDGNGGAVQSALLEREREAGVTLTFRRPRYQSYSWFSAGGSVRSLMREWDEPAATGAFRLRHVPADLGALASAGYTRVRSFAYSISPEQGFSTAVSAQGRRFASVFEGDSVRTGYLRLLGSVQSFHAMELGGFARHVLAFRAAAGGDVGSRSPGLKVGGAGGLSVAGPLGTSLGLGDGLSFPVRGYVTGSERGDRAFSATGEYRFPLALVQRGYRLLPVYVDRLWGTAFADAGAAWCVAACDPRLLRYEGAARPLVSVGAELGSDLLFFYAGPITLRGGFAVPLGTVQTSSGVGRTRPSPSVYLRLGHSF